MNSLAVPFSSRALGCTLAAALALACAPVSAGTKDACKLLSVTELSTIVGANLGTGDYTIPGSHDMCTWTASPQPAKGATGVQISLMPASDFTEMKSMASSMPKGTIVPVTGVGDDAFFTTMGESTSLRVRRGTAAVEIGVPVRAATPAESLRNSQALAKALALKIVARL